jgi:hypothetical protein
MGMAGESATWRDDDEIVADLSSGDPPRIAAGLRDLAQRMDAADEFELPPIGPEILAPFGPTVPEATQLALLKLITGYGSFVPPLSEADVRAGMVRLVLAYAEHYVAYSVALELKTAPQPAAAAAAAVREIVRHGLRAPRHVEGARLLVSRLLDGKDAVRQAVVAALREWPQEPAYQQVIEAVAPDLTLAERAQLGRPA